MFYNRIASGCRPEADVVVIFKSMYFISVMIFQKMLLSCNALKESF
jgi:hypothetical protein